jgi:iron complex transport system ATP-binding protein
MLLTVKCLKIGYGISIIDSSFSDEFKIGDIVVVKGDNGVGKSTFFKTLSGLIPAVTGEVILKENLSIGWVDSYKPDTAYLTVENYLSFGINPSEIEISEILKKFNLQFDKDVFIDVLSDGQFRKLSICRQFLKHPDILFLDEPSVYLDGSSKYLLQELLKDLSKSSLIFCSTHDLSFGEAIATRFLSIDRNCIKGT